MGKEDKAMNILEEVQIYVADRLNADSQLSGLCPFIFENKKDIDYEIKSALGKQGVVGLVMTPKATFAGAYEDKSLAWQIDELEIDIIENVTVNRGKKNGYVTGQDAAMRLFEVMCPLTGENEGQFNAVSYEEGEDNNLLVNKCVLKCLVHGGVPTPTRYLQNGEWRKGEWKGTLTRDAGLYLADIQEVNIGTMISSIGEQCFHPNSGQTSLSSVTIPETVTSIGQSAFGSCKYLSSLALPSQLSSIGSGAFSDMTAIVDFEIPDSVVTIGDGAFMGCRNLKNVVFGRGVQSIGSHAFQEDRPDYVLFKGKTIEQVRAMENYPWQIPNPSTVIHVTD